MTRTILYLLCLAGAGLGGCVYIAATPSVQGRAYVVKAGPTGSSYWNCDANGGQPICFQTIQENLKKE